MLNNFGASWGSGLCSDRLAQKIAAAEGCDRPGWKHRCHAAMLVLFLPLAGLSLILGLTPFPWFERLWQGFLDLSARHAGKGFVEYGMILLELVIVIFCMIPVVGLWLFLAKLKLRFLLPLFLLDLGVAVWVFVNALIRSCS